MDKSILKQLTDMHAEIEAEDKRITDMQKEIDGMCVDLKEVTDIVTKGRRGKKPLGICKVSGFESRKKIFKKRVAVRKRKALKELHIAQLEDMVIDAEEYIYSLNDSELRNIILYYCIDQKSWDEVAEAMGDGYTGEACKQKFSRFVRQK